MPVEHVRTRASSPVRDVGQERFPRGFARDPADREALVVLLGLSSVTPSKLLALAGEHRRATACLRAIRAGRSGSARDRARARESSGAEVLARVAALGGRFVTPEDGEYPRALLDLEDPPAGLFVRGRALEPDEPHVALVGARNCSDAGAEVAHGIGSGLAVAGVWVVSGGARGIDRASHEGALSVGGPTVAVMGSGLDVMYPPQSEDLFERVAAAGAIVTEYPPGTPAEPFRFPARNRIVAALARAVVVVEGAERSGSLITVEQALDIGREVLAVPGPVISDLSDVPNRLIRDGARAVRSAGDVLEDVGLRPPNTTARDAGRERRGVHGERVQEPTPRPTTMRPKLSAEESGVWDALQGTVSADRVAREAGLSLSRAVAVLIGLELRDLVRQAGGRWQRRVGWS